MSEASAAPSLISTLVSLTKPRLSLLTTLSGAAGYAAGADPFRPVSFAIMFLGILLTAGGALALNQVIERDADARMRRTRERPLPSGDVSLSTARTFGFSISAVGTLLLLFWAGWLPALLAVLTIVLYTLVYTPLKRKTHWCTLIGAFPGAIPPLIGWTAATGSLSAPGWIFFLLLFAWQMPHFFAIAFLYREDYEGAGLQMLTVIEPSGQRAATQSLFFATLLFLLPAIAWIAGWMTGLWALLATFVALPYLWLSLLFWKSPAKTAPARSLFFSSLLILPLILVCFIFGYRS
jgi:protoheme IX farnesyltransferase